MLLDSIRMILEDKPDAQVYSVPPTTAVVDAVQLMNRQAIGCVVVMRGTELVGIFTERDVLTRVIGAGLDPGSTLVIQVMTTEVLCLKPTTTIEEAMTIMTQQRHRHVPVIENNRVLGLLSLGDLMRWIIQEQGAQIEDILRTTRVYQYGF